MQRVIIGAAGNWPEKSTWQALVETADLIIAADAGALRMTEHEIAADIILGDMDSIVVKDISEHPNAEVINMPWQNDSDLVKALHWVAKNESISDEVQIDIIGVEGGRPDHALAAYAALFESPSPNTIIHLQNWRARAITESCEFHCPRRAIVSLFAVAPVSGLTIQGLKYELKDEKMGFSSLGLHNEGMGNIANITIKEGKLLMLRETQNT